MNPQRPKPRRVWTVAEPKARFSEVLRLAEEEGAKAFQQEKILRGRACRRPVREETAPQTHGAVVGGQHASRREPRYLRKETVPETNTLHHRRG